MNLAYLSTVSALAGAIIGGVRLSPLPGSPIPHRLNQRALRQKGQEERNSMAGSPKNWLCFTASCWVKRDYLIPSS